MFQAWDVFHVTKANFPWEILTFMRLWLVTNTVYVFAIDIKLSVRFEVLMLVTEDHHLLGCNAALQGGWMLEVPGFTTVVITFYHTA
jgi:hypothetical protein